jgi:hypothetical protein
MAYRDLTLVKNDLFIDPSTGDFGIQDSDFQHIQDVINSYPGWWKNYPEIGVGGQAYIKSSGQDQDLARNIKIQLQGDGFSVDNIVISRDNASNLLITPNAVRNT